MKISLFVSLALAAACLTLSAEAQDAPVQIGPYLQVGSMITGRSAVPGDVTGDGLSELLFYSPTKKQLQIWTFALKNTDESVLQKSVLRTIALGDYTLGATGDLDADGRTDLVFTSPRRDLFLWKSLGGGSFSSQSLGTYPAGWQLLGSADMDGDGTDDLLWLNAGTCQLGYWSFKKGVRTGTSTFPVDCDYQPVAVGYYALGKQASIIWSDATHHLMAWDGVPGGFNHASLGSYPTTDWVFRLGGGAQGGGMSLTTTQGDNSGWNQVGFSRVFSVDGIQRSWVQDASYEPDNPPSPISGGYMFRGQGFRAMLPVEYHTSSVTLGATPSVAVCIPSKQALDDYSQQAHVTCGEFAVDEGLLPVGASVHATNASSGP